MTIYGLHFFFSLTFFKIFDQRIALLFSQEKTSQTLDLREEQSHARSMTIYT